MKWNYNTLMGIPLYLYFTSFSAACLSANFQRELCVNARVSFHMTVLQ